MQDINSEMQDITITSDNESQGTLIQTQKNSFKLSVINKPYTKHLLVLITVICQLHGYPPNPHRPQNLLPTISDFLLFLSSIFVIYFSPLVESNQYQ